MAASIFTVVEADYLDEQDGLFVGFTVTAEPTENPAHLRVTHIGDELAEYPVVVRSSQLQAA